MTRGFECAHLRWALGTCIPEAPHSQHLATGNRGSLSRPYVCTSLVLWVAAASRSCSTCSSSPGQVVGVVKQSPPPRRSPRFERGTADQQGAEIFHDEEKRRSSSDEEEEERCLVESTRQGGREKVARVGIQ